jgi:hypothetical protein
MKTTFLKIATVLLLAGTAGKSIAATPGKQPTSTVFSWITSFSKIEIHGNVHVHLLSGENTKVEMDGNYFNHSALVQVENGILRITCYKAERLNVWITLDDLREIAAYDNVLVDTQGKFSSIDLDVELYNKAKASMDLDCFCTHIKLNDESIADISGTAMESDLAVNYASTLNSTGFFADQISRKRMDPVQGIPVQYALSGTNDNLSSPFEGIQDSQFSVSLKGSQLTVVNTH